MLVTELPIRAIPQSRSQAWNGDSPQRGSASVSTNISSEEVPNKKSNYNISPRRVGSLDESENNHINHPPRSTGNKMNRVSFAYTTNVVTFMENTSGFVRSLIIHFLCIPAIMPPSTHQ